MENMHARKALALAVVSVLSLGLAACSSGGGSKDVPPLVIGGGSGGGGGGGARTGSAKTASPQNRTNRSQGSATHGAKKPASGSKPPMHRTGGRGQ